MTNTTPKTISNQPMDVMLPTPPQTIVDTDCTKNHDTTHRPAMRHAHIHDPAIAEENGIYYLFGTHRNFARSADMTHWEPLENNLTRNVDGLLGEIWESWPKQPQNPDLSGNTWAPDVIWNAVMGKWCMYMSVNGEQYRSVIVLLTANHLDEDWTYVGPVIFSGFTPENVRRTDVPQVLGEESHGDLARYQSLKDTRINAIDAAPVACEHGEMWMSFGSWFGGIWMIKLDPATGLRDYGVEYPLMHDASDPYYGVKIAGGYWNSGEGSYFVHTNGYWYLFMAYGWLGRTGGYQIRLFRSKHLLGPYVDQNGNRAISNGEITENHTQHTGIRLSSSVCWSGGPCEDVDIEASQGHNSVLQRTSDGRLFLTYHTRFVGRAEDNIETHIRELFPTDDGWLTAAAYEYQGFLAVPVPMAAVSNAVTTAKDAKKSTRNSAEGTVIQENTQEDTDQPRLAIQSYDSAPLLKFPEAVCGEYELVRHKPETFFNGERLHDESYVGVNLPQHISLHNDGTVRTGWASAWNTLGSSQSASNANTAKISEQDAATSDRSGDYGTWKLLGASDAGMYCCVSNMSITLGGTTYIGVFAMLPREIDRKSVVTFSAIGGNESIWGSQV